MFLTLQCTIFHQPYILLDVTPRGISLLKTAICQYIIGTLYVTHMGEESLGFNYTTDHSR